MRTAQRCAGTPKWSAGSAASTQQLQVVVKLMSYMLQDVGIPLLILQNQIVAVVAILHMDLRKASLRVQEGLS